MLPVDRRRQDFDAFARTVRTESSSGRVEVLEIGMTRQIRRGVLASGLSIAQALACTVSAAAASVSTLAGSGSAGISDGPSSMATFLLPTGVAWGRDGQLYVADAAAQRIRVVLPSGRVETIAGSGRPARNGLWVAGGYADGDGAAAMFNFPSALAVGLHGEIYVADTNNHCIRMIGDSGRVTTFAGNPQRIGRDNGERRAASFTLPRSIAIDRYGDLFVADPMSGVRKITSEGMVSTIALPFKAPVQLAVSPTGEPILFVTNVVGLWIVELSSLKGPSNVLRVSRFFAGPRNFFTADEGQPETGGVWLRAAEGERSIGYPFAIAALDGHAVVYTDLRTHTVRYLDTTYQDTSILGGQAIEDAANHGAGFSNGRSAQSRFDAPMGIAARQDGLIAVADSGNKRIRIIRDVDRTEPLDPTAQVVPAGAFAPDDYRIAYLGNSFVWTNAHLNDSIGGMVQRRLEQDRALAGLGKHPRVITVRLGSKFDPLEQYLGVLASTRAVDAVVLQLNSFFASETFNIPLGSRNLVRLAQTWQGPTLAHLRKLRDGLRNAGIALLIVSQPLGDEISMAEQPYATIISPLIHVSPDGRLEQLFNAPISASGAPWLNMWSVFDADLRSPQHQPLFLAVDGHLTPYGNEVMAGSIAQKLEAMRPWEAR